MEPRKARILQAIVNDYVFTAEPVGSDRLVTYHNLGCKAATVRNEMAEMADMGYLLQPHTSAGRIPSDRGYRYYVDELMPPPKLPDDIADHSAETYRNAQQDIETLVLLTARTLAQMTSYPSLVTDPMGSTTELRRIYITAASPRRLLMVSLFSTGHVEHRLIELDRAVSSGIVARLVHAINERYAGRILEDVAKDEALLGTPPELTGHGELFLNVASAVRQLAVGLTERRIFLEGAGQILRQREFQDVHRLEELMNALEQRAEIYRLLSRAPLNSTVTIRIGQENEFEPMRECSIVSTSYYIRARQAGYLGVVGPTRMNYERTAAAVTLMARSLSNTLSQLSLA